MTWTTPTLVEICVGLEINGYLPAEFWFRPICLPGRAMPLAAWPRPWPPRSPSCGLRRLN